MLSLGRFIEVYRTKEIFSEGSLAISANDEKIHILNSPIHKSPTR